MQRPDTYLEAKEPSEVLNVLCGLTTDFSTDCSRARAKGFTFSEELYEQTQNSIK